MGDSLYTYMYIWVCMCMWVCVHIHAYTGTYVRVHMMARVLFSGTLPTTLK